MVSDTIKFIPEYVPIPIATIDDYIKSALEHAISLMKNRQTLKPNEPNNSSPISALIQVSNLFNNYPQNTPKVSPTDASTKTIVENNDTINENNNLKTTEGVYKNKRKTSKSKQIIKPMTDKEFELLLKNLKKILKTSEGENNANRQLCRNNPTESLRNKCLYANIPLHKISKK